MSLADNPEISFYPRSFPSSAFGEFVFGKSPFGVFPGFDWRDTVISQYANSPTLLTMLADWNDDLDQTPNYFSFYGLIWDVLTAVGYGLDVWGLIVGVSRNLEIVEAGWFGFAQGSPGTDTWGPGGASPWFTGESITSNFALTDDAYRQLILAKAAVNICSGSIPSINAILMNLFGPTNTFGPGGTCFVTNGLNMTMQYNFLFQPNPVQRSIIFNSGILPTPGGVVPSIVITP